MPKNIKCIIDQEHGHLKTIYYRDIVVKPPAIFLDIKDRLYCRICDNILRK